MMAVVRASVRKVSGLDETKNVATEIRERWRGTNLQVNPGGRIPPGKAWHGGPVRRTNLLTTENFETGHCDNTFTRTINHLPTTQIKVCCDTHWRCPSGSRGQHSSSGIGVDTAAPASDGAEEPFHALVAPKGTLYALDGSWRLIMIVASDTSRRIPSAQRISIRQPPTWSRHRCSTTRSMP